ncbi:MAG: thiamine diphosphokinase [Anaerolineaceae bacterium]|jgi:thiamine pyrophosphokinase
MKNERSALLVANGDPQRNLGDLISNHDFLIAVDGGLRHLLALKRFPDLLIGDLDSITSQELQACIDQDVEILRFKAEKDESDLELALLEALKRGYSDLTIANAGGGRVDHLLSNLSLLFHPALHHAQVKMTDQSSIFYPLTQSITLKTLPGDLISLIPWQGSALGVTTANLAYPLDNETLLPYGTRGLSNVALGGEITVSLQSGQILLVHTPTQE